mmetsp:Transcript_24946/g.58533  ORF Transcript_24946/g.58533 Transcript_24946/m.58533 type:complete len:439 (-) Transcript_24946:150-1466(-)|eukprot:CAMPEP_0197186214 /NCGR_PEP_ID=MMETSP1423-20130617/13437_1 /TAXON_ID=476441 /ORGANISM="Pseudo-nitzschia heimii, Strain UNC1101" /LENGTH=438 /DNA_ID=CAMNT_0042637449 /DNA_START=38 /DNA_END=1354 /DNA_ORIENTATION=+
MGLFGRKTKNKNRVRFGDDVGREDFHDVSVEKPLPIANSNSLTSSSSSSRKPHIEQGEGDKQQHRRDITSTDHIMLPLRESKAMSVCSDMEESNHQNPHENIVKDKKEKRNNFNDEAEYMYESDDIDEEIEFMDDVSSDPNEEDLNYTTSKSPGTNGNTGDINHQMSDSKGRYAIPLIPDLNKKEDICESGKNNNNEVVLNETKMSAPMRKRDTSNSSSNNNSNSNSTDTAKNKSGHAAATRISKDANSHDTSQLYQHSASSGSNGLATEQVEQRQKQHPQHHQENQVQHHSHQAQEIQNEIQREKTRDLVKIFIGEIWNRGEIESIQRVCSPRLRFNGHTGLERVGHDGFSRMVTTVRSSLEGYHCEIHSMVVEGRKCFCRLKFTGKHVGELMGYPPTYKLVAWMGASEFTICPRRNQILKVWELGDIKALEAQLLG